MIEKWLNLLKSGGVDLANFVKESEFKLVPNKEVNLS